MKAKIYDFEQFCVGVSILKEEVALNKEELKKSSFNLYDIVSKFILEKYPDCKLLGSDCDVTQSTLWFDDGLGEEESWTIVLDRDATDFYLNNNASLNGTTHTIELQNIEE